MKTTNARKEKIGPQKTSQSEKTAVSQTHTDPNRANNARKDKERQSEDIQRKTRQLQAHPREPRRTDTPEHHLGELGPKRPPAEPLDKQQSWVEFYPTSGQ